MPKDIRWFVGACSVCTQNKWSNLPSSVQLHPLPIPSCPWSHNALDFISGLPPSGGKSLILTVVDLFSKAVHLVPLSKRPKWSWTTSSEFMVSQRTCASVHLPYLEEILSADWCYQGSIFRVSPTDQQPDQVGTLGSLADTPMPGLSQPLYQKPVADMSRICP